MRFEKIDVVQRSPEWFAARAGVVTSSQAHVPFIPHGKKKSEESVTRRDYRIQLALEQIANQSFEDQAQYKGYWVERGKALEPEARAAYEARTGRLTWVPGFLRSTELAVGSSLDAVVGNYARAVELKVPKPATHISYLRDPNSLVFEYERQVLHHFWVSGVSFIDVCSYCPECAGRASLLVVEMERPSDYVMDQHVDGVTKFLREVSIERHALEATFEQLATEAFGVVPFRALGAAAGA